MNEPPIITLQGVGDASIARGIARRAPYSEVGPRICPNWTPIRSEDFNYRSMERMTQMNKAFGKDGPMKLVLCGCGKLHLTCGAVTLHLTREEFLVFAESVQRLAVIIARPSMEQSLGAAQPNPSMVCH